MVSQYWRLNCIYSESKPLDSSEEFCLSCRKEFYGLRIFYKRPTMENFFLRDELKGTLRTLHWEKIKKRNRYIFLGSKGEGWRENSNLIFLIRGS